MTALQTIKNTGAPFISRGDRFGTNIAELSLWKNAGIDIVRDRGPWYKEIGQGMGAARNMASASNAYVLSDRGTWLAFQNRGDLAIIVEGDTRLFRNPRPLVPAWAARKRRRVDFGVDLSFRQ